ncbi:MAG: hypothetical protein F4X76_06890 [Chloroflexi bacterium]|nr:hypothetical protein [Chloroflexota bacterium]
MPDATNPGPDRGRLLIVAAALGIGALLAAPPIEWLPPAGDARPLLGTLLGAQAAIAALTLAVTLFVLQVVGARQDADDRMSREYVRKSQVRPIFWSSVGAVGVTGLALLATEFIGAGAPVIGATPGVRNLALLAAFAFASNLVLAVRLFERAVLLAQPDAWRRLRRELYERNVRESVHAFLRRRQLADISAEDDEPDLSLMFPGPEEGVANEAIQSLLGYALRAMGEWRQGDHEWAIETIPDLVTCAMDTLERERFNWSSPGSQPEWPPLQGLDANLYPFREEVISGGRREYAFGLLRLDYWLLRTGIGRRCGELFTVGLEGYRRNYEITTRLGSTELHGMFRDRAWSVLRGALINVPVEEALPYMKHAVRQQERLLADAMSSQDASDFKSFMDGFSDLLRHLRFTWDVETRWPRSESAEHYEDLLQTYRIALMGLGGRAVLLSESQTISDPGPYLEAVHSEYVRAEPLAADMARALVNPEGERSLWSDWEMEGARSGEPRSVQAERYALTFFCVRLLELAHERMPTIDLGGSAQRVLDWFEANAGRLERHVQLGPDARIEQRREFAAKALRDAVLKDEVAADEEMARRELSTEKIAEFTAGVYAAAFSNNVIERLFSRAGAFEYLASAADVGLEERGPSQYISKGFLATEPKNARTHYGQLPGDEWGRSHGDDVVTMLSEALSKAPDIETPLTSEQDLLSAIDAAVDDLGSDSDAIVLLTGDWNRITFDLARDPPDGYEPRRGGLRVHALERGVEARYRGHPIIWDRTDGDRRLYVVEPSKWGCFVRAQVEGDTDLLVEVDAISEERAREMLSENPNHLPDIEDHDEKLRKMQTYVRVGVAARTEFRVKDPSRARKVVPPASE